MTQGKETTNESFLNAARSPRGKRNLMPVGVSGISGRFPESPSVQKFKENLFHGIDMVVDDDRRWKSGYLGLPRKFGKLPDLDKFDAQFFGIHGKQAKVLDPQVRILLECVFEAVLDAGVNPESLRNSETGVFVGVTISESEMMMLDKPAEKVTGYELLGNTPTVLANRISYNFDFKGPSLTVNTACSSSLLAVDRAVAAIRSGECSAAIVGGINLCLHPKRALEFHRLGLLSPEGRCKSFDEGANGFARSEAAVVVFLQRVEHAKRLYGTILHSKSNTNGYSPQGISFPSGKMQETLLRQIYQEADLDPCREVDYIEAHGTGTQTGDIQELTAITAVFRPDDQTFEKQLLIGSVKSNMGHSEPASGLCGLVKVVLSMQMGEIPGNLHFNKANSNIPALHDGRLKVVAENTKWTGGIAGINSFGIGGTNVHVIIKSATKNDVALSPKNDKPLKWFPVILPVSGRTRQAVESAFSEIQKFYLDYHGNGAKVLDFDFAALLHNIFEKDIPGHPFRGVAMAKGGKIVEVNVEENSTKSGKSRALWFIFTGMGCQWRGMGRDLLNLRTCAESLKHCCTVAEQFDLKLLEYLTDQPLLEKNTVDTIDLIFAALCAVQISLIDLFKSLGLHPEGFIGHSVGELACAYMDGCLSREETMLCAIYRGRAIMDCTEIPSGKMAAVGLTWQQAAEQCPSGVYPACWNSLENVTVSGDPQAVDDFLSNLSEEDPPIFAKVVASQNLAFHSKHIEPAAPRLEEFLKNVIKEPRLRSSRWLSTSIPHVKHQDSVNSARIFDANYLVQNLVSSVLFKPAVDRIPENAIVVEIAPHSLLQAVLKRSLDPSCTYIPTMIRTSLGNGDHVVEAAGKLFLAGLSPQFSQLYGNVEFPVSAQTPSISSLVKFDHSGSWPVPKLLRDPANFNSKTVEIQLGREEDSFYGGHVIDGRILFPATGYLVLIWKKMAELTSTDMNELPILFENVYFQRATVLEKNSKNNPKEIEENSVKFKIHLIESTGEFRIEENNSIVCSGNVSTPSEDFIQRSRSRISSRRLKSKGSLIEEEKSEVLKKKMSSRDFYRELGLRGYNYSGVFQGVLSVSVSTNDRITIGEIEWRNNWTSFLDTALQLWILTKEVIDRNRSLFVPTHLQKVWIDPADLFNSMNTDTKSPTKIVQVLHKKDVNTVQCPGIELSTIDVQLIRRRNVDSKIDGGRFTPILQEYKFVPYFDFNVENQGASKPPSKNHRSTLSTNDVLQFCLDVAIENQNSKSRFSITQVLLDLDFDIESSNRLVALSNHISKCFDQTLQIESQFTFMTVADRDLKVNGEVKGSSWTSNLDQNRINIVLKEEAQDLIPESGQSFIILSEPELLSKTVESLVDGGFLLLIHLAGTDFGDFSIESLMDQNDPDSSISGVELVPIACKKSQDGDIFYLLRIFKRRHQFTQNLVHIPLEANSNYEFESWLQPLKTAVKTAEQQIEEDQRIYITAQGGPKSQGQGHGQSGVIGLVNCLRKEPGASKVRCILNLNNDTKNPDFKNPGKILTEIIKADLVMNVNRRKPGEQFDQWGSFRHFNIDPKILLPKDQQISQIYLTTLKPGNLSNLEWVEKPDFGENGQDAHVTVWYSSINFRDVVLALGHLAVEAIPGYQNFSDCPLGLEWAGRSLSGERLMGLLNGRAIASWVRPHPLFTWRIPHGWSMAQAATVPMAYTTAYYALIVRGRLTSGESILIHSGSGALGQAAISIALSMNCLVFTTVGSDSKRKYLLDRYPGLNPENFWDSHDPDAGFEQHILNLTEGRGVDLVLNSLSGSKLEASVRCLAPHGRFLEVGKVDLFKDTKLGMKFLLKNVTFHGILLDSLVTSPETETNADSKTVCRLLSEGMASGVVQPLEMTIYPADQAEAAFRYMASGKHVGKVVLQIRDDPKMTHPSLPSSLLPGVQVKMPGFRTYFNPRKTHIIFGGLGGFGLELANFLVQRGAKTLILVSRSGVNSGYQKFRVETWRGHGVTIDTPRFGSHPCENENCNFNNYLADTKKLLLDTAKNFGPIGSIFNLAMVLDDAILENQTAVKFETVCRPKIWLTQALDQVTRELEETCCDLDNFVSFSSVTSGRGNAGQTNYGYANSFMERICEDRKKDGLPGLAIQWGAVGGVGILADCFQEGQGQKVIAGTTPQDIKSCLNCLDTFMAYSMMSTTDAAVLSSMTLPNKSGIVLDSDSAIESKPDLMGMLGRIFGMASTELIHQLGQNSNISTLRDIGMDSLIAVQVKSLLTQNFNMDFKTTEEIQKLTLSNLLEIQKSARKI